MMEIQQRPQAHQQNDLAWVGTRVKTVLKGRCPFCRGEIDFCSIDAGQPHRCKNLASSVEQVEVKEFTETEIMLIGPGYLVFPAVDRIQDKYPEVRIAVVVPV